MPYGGATAMTVVGSSVSGEPNSAHIDPGLAVSAATRIGGPVRSRSGAATLRRPGLVEHAVRDGIVSAMSVSVGELSVSDESRTNVVSRIDVAGVPRAYAKQPGWAARVDGDDPVGAERRALELLSGSGLVPRLLAGGGKDLLWTAPVCGGRPVHRLIGATRRADFLMLAHSWGAALAQLHRTPTRFGQLPVAARPWILEPQRVPEHLTRCRIPAAERALAELWRSPTVLAALDRVRAEWVDSHWTHLDMTTANVLGAKIGRNGWQVWFVDLESAGIGDPSWDLATAYDSLLFHKTSLGTRLAPALRAMLDGYRSGDGPGQLSRSLLVARAALTGVQAAAAAGRRAIAATRGPISYRARGLTPSGGETTTARSA
jgi:phosphotransferase family enzyme